MFFFIEELVERKHIILCVAKFTLHTSIDCENSLSRKSKAGRSDSLIYCNNRASAISAKLIPVKVENSQNYRRAGQHIISQLAVVFAGDFRNIT